MCDLNGCGTQAKLPALKIDPQQRRLFLQGLAALPLAAVLAYPELARAAAEGLETVSLKVGDQEVSAALALPEGKPRPSC
ncbi:MAG: hypothetical protein R3E89_09005 [Thiolinea sp.]